MTNGDAAIEAGMAVVLSTADRRLGYDEINKTRDYIAAVKGLVGGVTRAWTTAATAVAARLALGIDLGAPDQAPLRVHVPQYNASGQLTSQDPTLGGHVVNKQTADALVAGKLDAAGGTVGGNLVVGGSLYTPNNSPGGSGTIAYVQTSDGRITRGVSARKYKKYIRALNPATLGDLFPALVDYEMKAAYDRSGRRIIGYVADDMVGTDLDRFVVYDEAGEVEGFDVLQLLTAQVAQLRAEVDGLRNA